MAGKSLTERLLAATSSKYAATVNKSVIFEDDEHTEIAFDHPIFNVMFSGSMKGGFHAGNTSWAGPSKHFKSLFSLTQARTFIKSRPDAKIVLFDSEFGMPIKYFESVGIDPEDVIHVPVTNIEELKHEAVNLIEELDRGDDVIFVIDSVGMLASLKELDDARDGKTTADMTRAKQLKSFFRIVTPMLKLRNIGLIVVNHTYQTLEIYSQTVQGGGTGGIYAADNIFFIGRSKDTDSKRNLNGYDFNVKVAKSRFVREESKFTVKVLFEKGLPKYTGMFELLKDMGLLETVGKKYVFTDPGTGEVHDGHDRKWYDNHDEFWEMIVENEAVDNLIRSRFQLGENKLINDDD